MFALAHKDGTPMNVMLNNQPIQDGQVLLARQLLTFTYQPPPGEQPVLLLTTSKLVQPAPTRHATHERWYWHWHPLDYTGGVTRYVAAHAG